LPVDQPLHDAQLTPEIRRSSTGGYCNVNPFGIAQAGSWQLPADAAFRQGLYRPAPDDLTIDLDGQPSPRRVHDARLEKLRLIGCHVGIDALRIDIGNRRRRPNRYLWPRWWHRPAQISQDIIGGERPFAKALAGGLDAAQQIAGSKVAGIAAGHGLVDAWTTGAAIDDKMAWHHQGGLRPELAGEDDAIAIDAFDAMAAFDFDTFNAVNAENADEPRLQQYRDA
jgi:hypothetical protein